MSKTILLIENDAAFAREATDALEAAGFRVRVTGDGKEGLDLAREVSPAAIVLCVELPKMSGYSICQKLKKEEALRAIPLVLTSAEATAETFDQHRKLKARAEDYLIKPYSPATLLEKLGALIGLPEGAQAAAAPSTEEVVALEEEDLGLESLGREPEAELPALDLSTLPDEPMHGAGSASRASVDEDLQLLDDAFDGLSTPMAEKDAGSALDLALDGEQPVAGDDVDAASDSLPEEDEAPGRAELGGLGDEADDALGSLGEGAAPAEALDALDALGGASDEPAPAGEPAPPVRPVEASAIRGASAEALRAAGIPLVDEPPPAPTEPMAAVMAASAHLAAATPGADAAELGRLEAALAERRAAVAARDAEIRDLGDRLDALTRRAEQAESRLAERSGEIASLQGRAEALTSEARRSAEQVRAAEEKVAAAQAEAERHRGAAAEAARGLQAKVAELATASVAAARLHDVEHQMERLETELIVARGEVEGARSEVEKRSAELKKRIAELESGNAKNEERVVKAYLKIKGDEKVRDKARKALSIALQLLEEGLPPEPAERRPPASKLE